MSEEFDAQTITAIEAKFGELYDARGKPEELDQTFVAEYLQLIVPDLGVDKEQNALIPLPTPAVANLALTSTDKNLLHINLPSKNLKFEVIHTSSGDGFHGFFGSVGPGTVMKVGYSWKYELSDLGGFPYIRMHRGILDRAVFLSSKPGPKAWEKGWGTWEGL